METSNLDQFIVSLPLHESNNQNPPKFRYHQCNPSSSSSESPNSTITTITDSQEDQTTNSVSNSLKLQIPSSSVEFEVSNVEYGDCKTPRSKEHRIPVTKTCPPAPRKTRPVGPFPVNRKRKSPSFPVVRVPADFVAYVNAKIALNEAIYVPDNVVGDLGTGDYGTGDHGTGDHAKKLKLVTPPAVDESTKLD